MQQPQCIQLFVPGVPRPQGSKRPIKLKGSGRVVLVEQSKHVHDWRGDLRLFGSKAWGDRPVMSGPAFLSVDFIFARPRSHFRKRRGDLELREDAPTHKSSMPDTSKLLRAVEDAFEGVLYSNDSQIVWEEAQKLYGDRPGALILVGALENRGKLVPHSP